MAWTIEARAQAEDVLQRLMVDRRLSEQRFAEAGKKDPLKDLTGKSALEGAIASTREVIAHLNELIAELEGELPSARGVPEAASATL